MNLIAIPVRIFRSDFRGAKILSLVKLNQSDQDLLFLQDQEEMICRFLSDLTCVYANPKLCKKWGLAEEQLVGTNLASLVKRETLEAILNIMATLSPDNPRARHEHYIGGDSGPRQWQHWNISAIFNSYGGISLVQIAGRDMSAEKQQKHLLEKHQLTLKQELESKIRERIVYQDGHTWGIQGMALVTERDNTEAALRESEQRLHNIIDFLPDSTFVIDINGTVIAWNKAMEEMTGIKAQEMLGQGDLKYSIPFFGYKRPLLINYVLLDETAEHDYLALKREKSRLSGEAFCPGIGPQGAYLYGTAAPIYDSSGKVVGAIESIRNVTERRKMENAIRESEAKFRQLADTAPVLIYVLQGSQLIYVNQSFEHITGYTREECMDVDVWDFIHSDNREWVKSAALARQAGLPAPSRYQAKLIKKSGAVFWADFSTSLINFNGEPAVLGVALDITERKQAEEQISYLSFHDKLTGLYNRAYAEERLKHLDNGENLPLCLILGDVNGLKLVNDAFGHQYGDSLLKGVAKILSSCCEEQDLVARWGGDEFVILLPKSDEARAMQVCDKINRTCGQLNDFPVQISISLGVAVKKVPGKSIEEISRQAEDLMYRNKLLESRSNRSSFLYSLEKTLWVRSHETQAHTQRLRQQVTLIAQALNLQGEELNSLTLLAALHDIGKIAIPNSILDKPAKLDLEEWELMKKHPEIGYRIALSCPELAPIAEAILSHHERWDGNGYPLGLRQREIPLISRILSITDAYDVMRSGRPYQPALSEEEALAEVVRCSGTQFDPNLAALFIRLVRGEELSPRMRDIF